MNRPSRSRTSYWSAILTLAIHLLLFTSPGLQASDRAQAPTPTPIQSLDQVSRAVVRLEVFGAYRDPKESETTHIRAGTGFLIDPTGLIITNNHVVAGSALILVYLDGEERPHYASLVALSECSDLALLSLTGGPYPYLAWSEEKPTRGAEVYAFGFSSGQMQRSQGEIRAVESDYDSNIASSLETIIHTAAVSPGDSGGPLTDAQGRVIGVNYGARDRSGRAVTISAREAQEILARLQRSPHSESLGISGEAWEEGSRSGVWISTVQSGSPAAAAGLHIGDMLLGLGGQAASDGDSMAGYCGQLRGWEGTEPLDFEILRSGRRATTTTGQFTPVVPDRRAGQVTLTPESLGPVGFLRPAAWSDIAVTADEEDGSLNLEAAPELALFEETLGTALLTINLPTDDFTGVTPDEFLDFLEFNDYCQDRERFPHLHVNAGVRYEGSFDRWQGCSDGSIVLYNLVVRSQPGGQIVLISYFSLAVEDELSFHVLRHSLRPVAANAESSQPAAEEAENNSNSARILAASLNVRSGPGTSYGRISSLAGGQQVTIRGRNSACSWLLVLLPEGDEGWISANAAYVQLNAACGEIPEAAAPAPPPTPTPGPRPQPPAAPAANSESSALDPNLGCFLFENQIGTEVTITFTRLDRPWNITFQVPGNESHAECLEPGRYTYTLDAPPPWNSVNGELRIGAGDRFRFPIQER